MWLAQADSADLPFDATIGRAGQKATLATRFGTILVALVFWGFLLDLFGLFLGIFKVWTFFLGLGTPNVPWPGASFSPICENITSRGKNHGNEWLRNGWSETCGEWLGPAGIPGMVRTRKFDFGGDS